MLGSLVLGVVLHVSVMLVVLFIRQLVVYHTLTVVLTSHYLERVDSQYI